MKNRYLNCGVIKSFTIFFKKRSDIESIFDMLSNNIDINLFDYNIIDNGIYFDIKSDILNKEIYNFMIELSNKNIINKIEINDSYNNIVDNIKNTDDIFISNFNFTSSTNLSDNLYNISIEYINYYFIESFVKRIDDGFLNYLCNLNKYSISNILSGALCFGVN